MPLDTPLQEIEKIQSFISEHQKTPLSELLTSEGKFSQDYLELENSLSEEIKNELSHLAKVPILPGAWVIDANASKAEIKNKLDQLEEKLQQQLPEDKQPEIRKKIKAIKLEGKKIDVSAIQDQITQIETALSRLRKRQSDENIKKTTDISAKNRLTVHNSIQDLIESLPQVTALARCLEFIKLTRDKSIHIHRGQPSTDQTIPNSSPITTLQGLLDIKTDYWASVKLSIVKEKRKGLYWFADIEPQLNKQKEKSLSSRLLKNTTENSPQAPKNLSSARPKQHLAKTAPENPADANDREEIALPEEKIKNLQDKITSLTLEIQQLTTQNTVPQVSLQDPMDQYNDPNYLASLISQIEATQRKNGATHHHLEEDSDYAEYLESPTNDQASLLLLIAEKESRINELKDRITQIETNPLDQEYSTIGIVRTLRNLLRENQEQKEKIAAEKEISAQLEAKIKGLEEEKGGRNIDGNQELLDEYLTQLIAQDHQLQKIQHELETEIAQLKEVLTKDESKIQSLEAKKAGLENQLQTQQLEEKSLYDTLATKEKALEKSQANLAQLQSRFSSDKDEKTASDKALSTLEKELTNYRKNASEQIHHITKRLETANYQLQEKEKTAIILSNEIAQLKEVLTENTSVSTQQAKTQQKKIHDLNDQLAQLNTQVEEEISNRYRKPPKSRIIDSSARANHQGDPMPEQLINHEEKISHYGHITSPLTNREEEFPTTTLNGEHSLSSSVSLDSVADETEVKSTETSLASSEESLNKETQTIVLTEPENNSLMQQLNDRMSQAHHGIKALFLEKAQQLINSNPSEQNLRSDAEALANEALTDPYHEALLSDLTARAHKIYQDNKEDNAENLKSEVQRTLLSEKEEEIQKALEETFARMEEVEAEKHKTKASLIPDLNHSTILLKLEQIAYGALAVGLDADSYIASQTTLIGLKHQLRALLQGDELAAAKTNLEQELVNDGTTPEQIVALITDEDTLNDRLIKIKTDQSENLIEQVHKLAQNAVTLETKNHQNKTPEDLEKEWRITLGFSQNADIRLQLALHNATSRELLVFAQEEQDYLRYLSSCIEIKDLEQKKYHLSQKMAHTSLTNSEKNAYRDSIQLIEQIAQNKGSVDSHSLILRMLEKPLVACIQKNDQTSKQAVIRSAGLSHLFKLTQSTDELEQARIELQNKLASDRSPNAFAVMKEVSTHESLLFEPGSTLLEAARITTRKRKESTFIYKTVKTAHITEFSIDSINGDIRPTTIKKYANHRDFIRFSTQSMLEFAQGSGEKPEEKGMGILILNTNDLGWQQRLAYIKAHQAIFPSQKMAPLIFLEGKYTNAILREPRFKSQLEKLVGQYIQEYNKEKELYSQPVEIANERATQTMLRGRGT